MLTGALLLIAGCALFVAAEFALVTVDRRELEHAAAEGDRRAAGGLVAVRTLSTQLSGAQIGITVTNLGIGFLAEPSIARLLRDPLAQIGVTGGAASALSVIVALVLSTLLTMVFGELVPKNLALARPLQVVRAVQAAQRGFTALMGGPIRIYNGTANALLRRVGIEPQEELSSARSRSELRALVHHSARRGTLEQPTAQLLAKTMAFGQRRAADVMTPRVALHVLYGDEPVIALYEAAERTGHSRFPVLARERRQVLGVAHVKHVVAVPVEERSSRRLDELMTEPIVIPSTLGLDPLLEVLREAPLRLAVVVDEFGELDGIVTMEDLVEELVGEVVDEHDNSAAAWRQQAENRWELSALLRPDEVSEIVGPRLPEDSRYETLGGLLAHELGRIPKVGDALTLRLAGEADAEHDLTLTVLAMDGLRVDRVECQIEPAATPQAEEERDG